MSELPIDILVVDDEREYAEALAERLEIRGHRVRVAVDGPGALALLDEGAPDVVVLDVLMPGMDGIAVLRELKARAPLVEVVLLTGHTSAKEAEEGRQLGAFDYLLKPVKFEELVKILSAAAIKKARTTK